jgi:hypothetical protein
MQELVNDCRVGDSGHPKRPSSPYNIGLPPVTGTTAPET